MAPQVLATVATVLAFTASGNRVEFKLDHGAAEIVWVTDSTFRFRRSLDGPLAAVTQPSEIRSLDVDDLPSVVRIRARFLEVTVQKSGALLRVRRAGGTPLLTDLSEPRPDGAGVTWDRQSPAGARFLGLGPGGDLAFDLSGKALRAEEPFLLASTGYAEYHLAAGGHQFDFAAPDRYTIRAPAVDYYFYYGPTVKQIFEEHHRVRPQPVSWSATTEHFGSWATLRAMLLRLVHGSMSAMNPSVNLGPYVAAPAELLARARQLGSLVDDVSPGKVGLSPFREQLETFFSTYAAEFEEKGFPIWHPLPFQFSEDPEAARHADEFMLGDEMLVAPIYEPGGKRSMYLPQGIWTNFETNELIPGRRTISVATESLPVFARNGTIVPLDSPEGITLHYFPKLGAEFFLFEKDPDGWTQVHAAPAGDLVRLEIDNKKARDYQWVVHHIARPSRVAIDETPLGQAQSVKALQNRTWFYDTALKNLHIRVSVAAGEDSVINVNAEL
jgi:hypothetical protein